ncbi:MULTISPECIES: cytochrome c-type biogenesis protein CcmH [Persephonella]|nr:MULTISPECIES: cytochrome c-type biogenesis protein CcmH [Persephonella]
MEGMGHGGMWILWILGVLFLGAGFLAFIKYLFK